MFFKVLDDFKFVTVDFGKDSEVSGALEECVVVCEQENGFRQNHVPMSCPSEAEMLEEDQNHLEEQEEAGKERHVSEENLKCGKQCYRVVIDRVLEVCLLVG